MEWVHRAQAEIRSNRSPADRVASVGVLIRCCVECASPRWTEAHTPRLSTPCAQGCLPDRGDSQQLRFCRPS